MMTAWSMIVTPLIALITNDTIKATRANPTNIWNNLHRYLLRTFLDFIADFFIALAPPFILLLTLLIINLNVCVMD